MSGYTTQAIADELEGELRGPGDVTIRRLQQFELAGPGELTFIGSDRYARRWSRCRAGAALVSRGVRMDAEDGRPVILVADADLAMARALALFAEPIPRPAAGAHPSAVIEPTAELGDDVAIGAHCYVGRHARLGAGCVLHAGARVLAESELGPGCELWPGVVIRERCRLGARCILHPNAVVGADGFGYRPAEGERGAHLAKVPQIGTVRIGDDVELGAGTCVDRGKFAATTLGDGCKLDNLVQVGHNCQLAEHVVIAGHVAIGGSVTIEPWVRIGGFTGIRDHVRIGRSAELAGGTQVYRDVPAGVSYGGSPARPVREMFREMAALRKLPALLKQRRER